MLELKFKRKTGWDGPDLDRAAERHAAEASLKVLADIDRVFAVPQIFCAVKICIKVVE